MSRETITVHTDGTNPVESASRSLQGHLDSDDHRIVEVEVSLTIEPVADPDETDADPRATDRRAPNARLDSPGRISEATGHHELLAAMYVEGATSADDGISARRLYEATSAGERRFSTISSASSGLSTICRQKRLIDRAKQHDSTGGVSYEYWLNDDGLAELERLDNSVFGFDVDI